MWEGSKERCLEWVDAPPDSTTSERRRMQNRVAQRNHRKRSKEKQGEHEQTETNTLVWKPPCTIPRSPARARDQKQNQKQQQQQRQKQQEKQQQQRQQHTFSGVRPTPAPAPAKRSESMSWSDLSPASFTRNVQHPEPDIEGIKHQQRGMADAPPAGPGSIYGMPKLDDMLLDPMDDFSEFLAADDTALPPSPPGLLPTPKSSIGQAVFPSESDFAILDPSQQHFDSNEQNNNTTGAPDLDLSGGDANPSSSSWDLDVDAAEPTNNNNDNNNNNNNNNNQYDLEDLATLSTDTLKFSGYNALHLAAYHGQPRIIRLLLTSKRVDANSVTRQGVSALHIAAASAHGLDAARELLDLGADAWLQDCRGLTALHVAVESGSSSVARLLVGCRGESLLHVRDSAGCTPLHKAIELGREEIVGFLLDCGADPAATVL
ncbi:ankyrin repeat-containing domain protein [Lasiosphaeris hirsuta]|uniref:Ankyrin repeat-containing domain protein n=1 Tax=Lasiosphaeris hirsuta TaxID=260670 RepID=A0AA40DUI9_9PEZI|nr:ankyrin repeat-containing domain protein [Lasiosphaeris hirsuta]